VPLGAQATVQDIVGAFRTIPVHKSHKKHLLFYHRGHYYINHVLPFGVSSSTGLHGQTAEVILKILLAEEIGPLGKWVDDIFIFRFPIYSSLNADGHIVYHFGYDVPDIYRITEQIQIPWHLVKGTPFAEQFKYSGLDWDIPARTVAVPESKRQKFLLRVDAFLIIARSATRACNLKTMQSLHGSLSHVAYVSLIGRTHLPSLQNFINSFDIYNNPSAKFRNLHIPSNVVSDVVVWQVILSQPVIQRPIRPAHVDSTLSIYVDASDSGIGLIVDGRWAAWVWKSTSWKQDGRDIHGGETIAMELALLYLISIGYRNKLVLVHGDNQGVFGLILND
jgi:hypothetical protein